MNKLSVPNIVKDVRATMAKRSPEILIAIGIASAISATVLAVKETPKALKLIEEKKKAENKDELTPLETVKTCWKCYIPATVSTVVSVACLVSSNSVNAKRNAALATAYKLSETALSEYRDAVVETIGEKKEQIVKDKVAEKKLEKNPVSQNNVIVTDRGTTLCYDGTSGRYFNSDMETIRRAENRINKQLLDDMYVSLNEFYDELDLEHTELGDQLGWHLDDGLIQLDFSSRLTDDGRPCLVMSYNIAPKYDYYKFG